MTREEAISLLRMCKREAKENFAVRRVKALNIAINVLLQKSLLQKLRIEIEQMRNSSNNNVIDAVLKIIDKYIAQSEEDNETDN